MDCETSFEAEIVELELLIHAGRYSAQGQTSSNRFAMSRAYESATD